LVRPFLSRSEDRESKPYVNPRANLDSAPTSLDFASVAVPHEMQGRSWQPLAKDLELADWRDAFYDRYREYPHGWPGLRPHCVVRTDRYKLTRC